jgi:hypothetical protein
VRCDLHTASMIPTVAGPSPCFIPTAHRLSCLQNSLMFEGVRANQTVSDAMRWLEHSRAWRSHLPSDHFRDLGLLNLHITYGVLARTEEQDEQFHSEN